MLSNQQETVLVTFTEEMFNWKLHFSCSDTPEKFRIPDKFLRNFLSANCFTLALFDSYFQPQLVISFFQVA